MEEVHHAVVRALTLEKAIRKAGRVHRAISHRTLFLGLCQADGKTLNNDSVQSPAAKRHLGFNIYVTPSF